MQRRRFDVLWAKLNQDENAAGTLENVQRWFAASAAIAVRRLMDEKHMSLYTVLEQMSRHPAYIVTFSGEQWDALVLKADRGQLREATAKTLHLAHNEVAHKNQVIPLDRRPKFSDVARAIEGAYQAASKYDALLSGCTYILTDDGIMLPTILAGPRFEEVGATDLRPYKQAS